MLGNENRLDISIKVLSAIKKVISLILIFILAIIENNLKGSTDIHPTNIFVSWFQAYKVGLVYTYVLMTTFVLLYEMFRAEESASAYVIKPLKIFFGFYAFEFIYLFILKIHQQWKRR